MKRERERDRRGERERKEFYFLWFFTFLILIIVKLLKYILKLVEESDNLHLLLVLWLKNQKSSLWMSQLLGLIMEIN